MSVLIMSKQEAYSRLNTNRTGLAKLLNIRPEAISQWDDEEIPQGRAYQILKIEGDLTKNVAQ